MKSSNILVALTAAASLAVFASAASAAPGAMAGAGAALKSDAAPSTAEPVRYSCWWNGHRRVCTWSRPVPHYGLYWGPPRRHFYSGWGYGRGWAYGRRHR